MSRSAISFFLAGCFGVGGCGHGHLVPSDAAKVVPGTDGAAFVVADGLRCTAEAAAWKGRPDDLPAFVAPIKVRIRNDSDVPVRLRYQDFVLLGTNGRKYRPLPPVPMDHQAGLTISPIYAAAKFFVAPLFHDVYPDLPPWSNRFPRDQVLYDQEYAKWGDSPPGRYVLREGLPEGMLDAGGSVTGFLYFENPVRREDRATFEAELERGGVTNSHSTTIKIPFRVD
jgi:hypothetical protein